MNFRVSREMYNIEDQHFSLNRALLLGIGLWPYQRTKLVQIQTICFFTILISSIVSQLTTFVTSKCSTNLVIRVLSFTFAYIALTITYSTFCIHRETVKLVMEQLQHIYDNLKDNNERAIIEKYGKRAKRHTTTVTIFYTCCLLIILIAQFWSELLVLLSINISEPRRLLIIAEYFVDEEKYFYLLLLHMDFAGCVGVVSLLATGTTLAAYFQHACGMFEIASYRIEQWINIYIPNCTGLWNGKLNYAGLTCAVDIHRRAMMFSKNLMSKFEISFLLLIICGVLILSLNIFRFFQVASWKYNTGELLIHLAAAFICIIYMFLVNFMGQEVIDHNNNVYTTAYKVQWYKAPVCAQKMTLFLLQRGSKPFALHVGRVFVSSIQCFASLANTSISYFTVMYSVR